MPDKSQDTTGLRKFFKQFSFPGGIGSHCTPETPGSIHEGGELGYVLSHAYGAAFDAPELLVPAMVGDGEAVTARWPPPGTRSSFSTRSRRRRAAGPSPQRLQDQQPFDARWLSHNELDGLFQGYG